jgi:pimeloyl-ACP methyl ester carboxylesterase
MLTSQFWNHAEGRLHLVRSPSGGRRILFLHGVLRSWETFLPLLAPLSCRYELVAFDHRGHGQSHKPERGYLTVDYAEPLQAWLESEVREPVVVYGHSLGAMVALLLASRSPHRIAGVVLEDPPFHTMGSRIASTPWQAYFRSIRALAGSRESTSSLAAKLAAISWTDPASGRTLQLGDVRDRVSLRFLAHSLRDVPPAVLDPIVAGSWLDGYDLAAIAAQVRCPVLLLQADSSAGGTLIDEDVAVLESHVADLLRIRFANAGHNLHTARTQEIVNLVFNFVESLQEPRE